jgi:hypothetical protein
MTEAEWLACADPTPMLEFLRDRAAPRKLRLFACACVRHIWPLLGGTRSGELSRRAVEVAERHADGLATDRELARARGASGWVALDVARAAAAETAWRAAWHAPWHRREDAAAHVALLREIFGNPFRPPICDPAWRAWNGGAVPRLARSLYDEGRFAELPVLADALEEAGCADGGLLGHCRRTGGHVRGCWALDLLLGWE